MLLVGIHVVLTFAWFNRLVAATRPFATFLARPATTRALEGIAGSVLIGFGLRLAWSARERERRSG